MGMKKAFNKYAEELPDDEVALFNQLVTCAQRHMKVDAANLLEFLQGELAAEMTAALHLDAYKILKSHYILTNTENEHLEDSIATIIDNVQIRHNNQLERINKKRLHKDPDVFSIGAYHPNFLNRLANDVNTTLKYASVLVAESAMAVHDVTLVRANWMELYFEPVSLPKHEALNAPETRDIADMMTLAPDEVFGFLNGYFSCALYEDVCSLCPNLTRDQREKFFYAFDDLMDDVKDYYSDVAKQSIGAKSPDPHDPIWYELTDRINGTLEETAPAICMLLVAAHDTPICAADLKLLIP